MLHSVIRNLSLIPWPFYFPVQCSLALKPRTDRHTHKQAHPKMVPQTMMLIETLCGEDMGAQLPL